ncbi:hypothetical protein [Sphingomonas glacialis]|uniref:hypothetical protein n=1 Tax=Sphingomonas glacialis TaxID=658225 RepID=UPI001F4F8B32|nr:hypothetical protein [Sphingomonas glacialis]
MDQATADMNGKPECPENEQDDNDSPKHRETLYFAAGNSNRICNENADRRGKFRFIDELHRLDRTALTPRAPVRIAPFRASGPFV